MAVTEVQLNSLQQEIQDLIQTKAYTKAINKLNDLLKLHSHWSFYLQLGNCYQQLKNFTVAKINFNQALKLNPNSSTVYNSLGLNYYKQSLWTDAKQYLQKAIRLNPISWESHFNLANTLTNLECHIEALSHYQAAYKLQPQNNHILHNLTFSYVANGEFLAALPYLKELSNTDPNVWPYLAQAYTIAGLLLPAINAYLNALKFLPNQEAWYHNLAILYLRNEDHQHAKHYFALAVQLNPTNITAKHMLAALSGHQPTNIPQTFVQDLFAQYADHYNQHMKSTLNYQLPGTMRAFFGKHIQLQKTLNVLDLGCGTGLSGIAFKDLAKNIIGVDLSLAMLKQAQDLKVYDYLLQANINCSIPGEYKNYFQLIISVEVLSYIGALESLFINVSNTLCTHGWFLFSIEEIINHDYSLQPSGRFAYNNNYIIKCANNSNLTILASETTPLREHLNKSLFGKIYLCQKKIN